jgi:hypothetical protein
MHSGVNPISPEIRPAVCEVNGFVMTAGISGPRAAGDLDPHPADVGLQKGVITA